MWLPLGLLLSAASCLDQGKKDFDEEAYLEMQFTMDWNAERQLELEEARRLYEAETGVRLPAWPPPYDYRSGRNADEGDRFVRVDEP